MISVKTVIAVSAVAASAVAVPIAAAAGSSHATLWQNKAHTVVCGIELYAATNHATDLLCSAKGIPGAKGTTNQAGDPFVTLPTSGMPKLVRVSQYQFQNPSDKPSTLAGGTVWSTKGITCTVSNSSAVTCRNKSKHGFTIGNGKYKSF